MNYNYSKWFLDYVGLNSDIVYLGDWEKDDYKDYQSKMDVMLDEFVYKNGYKEHQRLGLKPIRFRYNGDTVNTIFSGAFFKSDNIRDDVKHLLMMYEKINDELFMTSKVKYNDKVQRFKPRVYRLDVATNIPPGEIKKMNKVQVEGRSNKLRKYFEDDDRKKVTGLQYGNRGSKSVHLRCYEKKYDKNNAHDYLRFNEADFTRIEYELGTRPIKNYGFRYLEDLPVKAYREDLNGRWHDEDKFKFVKNKITLKKLTNWESLLSRVHRTANCIIPNRPVLKPFEKKVLPNRKYEPLAKYYYKEQVEGIIFNHYTREEMAKLSDKLAY